MHVGGSTIILLFQPGTLVFDDDLVANASQSLETLVKILWLQADNSFEWVKVLDIIQVLLKSSARMKRWSMLPKKIFGMRLEGSAGAWRNNVMDSVNLWFIVTHIREMNDRVLLFITMLCPYEFESSLSFRSTPMR